MRALEQAKPIQYTRWLSILLGVWPHFCDNSTNNELLIGTMVQIIGQCLLVFTVIPSGYHLLLREKDLEARIVLSGPVGFFTLNMLKYGAIIYHRDDIKMCIGSIKNDWEKIKSEEDYEIMMESVLKTERITFSLAGFMYSGAMFYHAILPFLIDSPVSEYVNITHRPLVFPGYDVVFDPYVTPIYEIIFSMHFLTAIVVCNTVVFSVNMAAGFVTHVCAQIRIMMTRLECLSDENINNSANQKGKISTIIAAHTNALKFSKQVNAIFREICFCEVIASTLIICLLESYIISTWSDSEAVALLTYLAILIALTFNIFTFCYIGELLQEQWYAAGLSIYMTEWYHIAPKNRVAVMLFIATSQVPQKLTAGGYMDVTLTSFALVMKSSFAYLNLLRSAQS